MEFKDILFKEIIKKGVINEGGKKIYDLANRSLLYVTPELLNSFLKLKKHPRYKKTVLDIEYSLLKKHSSEFLKNWSEGEKCNCNVIEMGCEDDSKAQIFLDKIKDYGKFRFCAVSVNEKLADSAIENIRKRGIKNVTGYKKYTSDLESLSQVVNILRDGEYRRSVILLFGSIIASFDIHDYLFNLSNAMLKGDYLIIGNGIRKGKRLSNIGNYKHPLFKNWLNNLMISLGFEEREFEYDARFANGRVECFHRIKKDKLLKFGSKAIKFNKGDEIISAILYKYFAHELEKICKMYFCEVKLLHDKDEEYAIIFCKK